MSDYIGLQVSSRVVDTIPTSVLSSTFTGLNYDGTELGSSGFGSRRSGVPGGDFGGGPGGVGGQGGGMAMFSPIVSDAVSYEIPGLVMKTSTTGTGDVEGTSDDTTVFETSAKSGQVISVKVNSIANRDQVISDLNELGYAYQDINDLDIFAKVQSTLSQVSIGLVIGFIILTVATIILTMSKFVSDSTKEIGIFRAIGFTKKNILTIFLSQSVMYTLVGYIVGLGLGFGLNLAVSPLISAWFDSLITETIEKAFSVTNSIDYGIFRSIDLKSIAIFTGILVFVTLVISIIPSVKASNISPVEAIKNE
jgi:ABC-type antimicrobial peptide transport system permease subunit